MIFRNPRNQTAIDIVNNFATMLAGRFNPVVGCTQSWDASSPTSRIFTVSGGIVSRIKILYALPMHLGYHR